MSSLIVHRAIDPFFFYKVIVTVNGVKIKLDQDEHVRIELNPGNYFIKAGFRIIYKSKLFFLSISEGEEVELEISANVDYNKPFDSLNWSLRFNNLYLITRKGEQIQTNKTKFQLPKFPKYYPYLLAVICLLPVACIFNTIINSQNLIFILIFPLISSLIYLSFGISRKKSSIMPAESELTSGIIFIIVGLISKFYVLYLIAGLIFIIFYFIRFSKIRGKE